jgi:hypothetical protein
LHGKSETFERASLFDGAATRGGYARAMARRLSLLLPVLAFALQGCFFTCGTDEVSRATSPDEALDAVVHVRNCGATTDFNTNVSILRAGDASNHPGNVFVAERGGASLSPVGGVEVTLRWLGPEHLLVTYDDRAEVFLQVIRHRGIRIDYRTSTAARPR